MTVTARASLGVELDQLVFNGVIQTIQISTRQPRQIQHLHTAYLNLKHKSSSSQRDRYNFHQTRRGIGNGEKLLREGALLDVSYATYYNQLGFMRLRYLQHPDLRITCLTLHAGQPLASFYIIDCEHHYPLAPRHRYAVTSIKRRPKTHSLCRCRRFTLIILRLTTASISVSDVQSQW